MVGSNNKLNNAIATIKALCSYKHAAHFTKMLNEKKTMDKAEKADVVEKKEEVKSTT